MLTLTKTAYNELKKYESIFKQAVYGLSYSGVTTQTMQHIVEITKNSGWNKAVNISCNQCRLKALQEIGKAWFAKDKEVKEQNLESLKKAREAKAAKNKKEKEE